MVFVWKIFMSNFYLLAMNSITSSNFSTNRKMLDKNLLRYCENYASYLCHLKGYISDEFQLAWLHFLKVRIKQFLKDAPHSEATYKFEARYQRILTKLEKL